jgi:hypothetical protein
MDMNSGITISMKTVLSLKVGAAFLFFSIVAIFAGSLPDNPPRPVGNLMRWIFWPLLVVWIIARVVLPHS